MKRIQAFDQNTAVDTKTGEILDTICVDIPIGSIVYTPQQQAEYKDRKERERNRSLRFKDIPKFSFVNSSHRYDDIKPETVGRLMYLATYLKYNSNILGQTERTFINKEDLQEVMGLHKSTFWRFWNEVNNRYLTESPDGKIYLSDAFFIRGQLRTKDFDKEWNKLYIEATRKLYKLSTTENHKYLGYVFQMLPYVNINYNILCHNPTETELDRVNPINVNEFCLLCGYSDTAKRTRLIKRYSEIYFDIKSRKERFCSFVSDGVNLDKAHIFINPNIIYRGEKWKEVKILGRFCIK